MADVLAVAPHPDDIEIAAGGTVALLVREGREVRMLDLTRGERATRGTAEARAREADEAARILGVASRECLDLPDGGVDARSPEQLNRLVEVVRRHRPRLVIALYGEDDHPDHAEAAEMVRRAAYLAGLRNYPAPGASPHRPQRVLYAMGRRPFRPTLIVDVSRVHAIKQHALAAFSSQFHREAGDPLVTPISDPGFLPTLVARDRYFGGWIGAEFGEPFLEEGPCAVRTTDALFDAGGGGEDHAPAGDGGPRAHGGEAR